MKTTNDVYFGTMHIRTQNSIVSLAIVYNYILD